MELLSVPALGAFLLASFVLAITPGPGVFYIVTRTLAEGRRSGIASVAGVALGNLGNAIAAALGLAALFALSDLAFLGVRYVGAAYLVYLGVRLNWPGKLLKVGLKPPWVGFSGMALLLPCLIPKPLSFLLRFSRNFCRAERWSIPASASPWVRSLWVSLW